MKTFNVLFAELIERLHQRRVTAIVERETAPVPFDWDQAEVVCRAQREKQAGRGTGWSVES